MSSFLHFFSAGPLPECSAGLSVQFLFYWPSPHVRRLDPPDTRTGRQLLLLGQLRESSSARLPSSFPVAQTPG